MKHEQLSTKSTALESIVDGSFGDKKFRYQSEEKDFPSHERSVRKALLCASTSCHVPKLSTESGEVI
jgi:hypothetical protein